MEFFLAHFQTFVTSSLGITIALIVLRPLLVSSYIGHLARKKLQRGLRREMTLQSSKKFSQVGKKARTKRRARVPPFSLTFGAAVRFHFYVNEFTHRRLDLVPRDRDSSYKRTT